VSFDGYTTDNPPAFVKTTYAKHEEACRSHGHENGLCPRCSIDAMRDVAHQMSEAWCSALHKNDIADVKDADGANGKFLLAIVQEELAQKR
jgi:hypothetical protein